MRIGLLGVLVFAISAVFAGAGQQSISSNARPNFSGVWKLNLEKSDFGLLPPPVSRIDAIDHKEPVLKVLTKEKEAEGDREYTILVTTDGQPSINTIDGVPIQSSGTWKGNALVYTANFKYQESDVSMTNRLTLSSDGQTLTVDSHLIGDLGEMDLQYVYDRQSP